MTEPRSRPPNPPIYWLPHAVSEFEVSQSREVRNPTWIALRNDPNRGVYAELFDHPRGAEHFAAYIVIVMVASRAKPRWHLVDELGRPHTAETLARVTKLSVSLFSEVFERLLTMGVLQEVKRKRSVSRGLASERAASAMGERSGHAPEYGTGENGGEGTLQKGRGQDGTGAGAQAGRAYLAEFTDALTKRGIGNPDGDPGTDVFLSKMARACESESAEPRVAAAIVADLFRASRMHGKPHSYIEAAAIGEIRKLKCGTPSAGLRKVAG